MSRRTTSAARGLTLVEVLVIMVTVGLVLTLTYPAIQQFIHRSKIEGMARKTASMMRLARMEAVRHGRQVLVVADTDSGSIQAFVDENRDRIRSEGDQRLGEMFVPRGVLFEAPGDLVGTDSVEGFEISGTTALVVFNSDGSGELEGALRFADVRRNFLEVRLSPRGSGKVSVRKWNGVEWVRAGDGDEPWSWS